jgi:hypothetical protein
MSSRDNFQRTVLPIPDRPHTGLITYDAKEEVQHFLTLLPNLVSVERVA